MIPNYYTLLGVTPRASTTEIKRAYRHLARQHHPDVSVQSADEQIKRVNEAYAVLRDAKRRALYDEQLRQAWLHAEAVRRERVHQQQAQREPQMTWMQGVFGFVRELKKGMHDD